MKDTSDIIRKKMISMMRKKSGEERLKMGASMFDMAKQLVLASRSVSAASAEGRTATFLKFYGHDFPPEARARILLYLSQWAAIP